MENKFEWYAYYPHLKFYTPAMVAPPYKGELVPKYERIPDKIHETSYITIYCREKDIDGIVNIIEKKLANYTVTKDFIIPNRLIENGVVEFDWDSNHYVVDINTQKMHITQDLNQKMPVQCSGSLPEPQYEYLD